MTGMERRVGFNNKVLLWTLFLISFVATLTHGGVGKVLPMVAKHHLHAKEAIIGTFEVDGHVIDCIDVNKQPAFRHPLLIHHTLQMKPTYYPDKMRVNDYPVVASHAWNLSTICLEGSIPIRKVQRNGHFADSTFVRRYCTDPHCSLWKRGMENQKDGRMQHEHSSIQVHGGKFYGSKTSISVWNPKVENRGEFSVSQIWIISTDKMISLEAGWAVYPGLYGDDQTRFFIYWTTDNYTTGCFNLLCPGFVQTNHHTIIDSYLRPVSVYGGPQFSIDVEIFKDRTTANWWLHLQGVEMGYWPKELVPSLADGAGYLEFGGEVVNLRSGGVHTGTQMGSGHFSYEGFTKSSFFKNIQVLDASYTYKNLSHLPIDVVIESPKCYDLDIGRTKDGPWGYFFFYGGPGRSGQCT